jgi:energy-coupling factor transport system ATP-binding protein
MGRAGDDVAFGLENRGVAADEIWRRVDEALALVGFPYGRDGDTGRLSGGEQQRLALAGVLALRPGLLLLDEVTANLDPDGVALVRTVLDRVLDETGATAVVVEHRVEAVLDLVTRAVVLEPGGGVVADGPVAEVFARQGDALAARGVWVPGRQPGVPRRSQATAGPTLLSGRGVGFRYPARDFDALAPTDITVRSGRALALTGPNGTGKSTLALAVAGLLRPTYGDVVAEPALDPPAPTRAMWRWRGRELVTRVGTVFQDPEHQIVTSSVREELRVGPLRAGRSEAQVDARADELLERLGLTALAAANPYTLSGGEKRRLSVATAIATSPRVVVADEPTYGQDSRTWAELVALLAELRDGGCGLLLVTHDQDLVTALADDTVIMNTSARKSVGNSS